MSDKKMIVSAIILSAILIGGGWYYSKYGPPLASIGSETPTPTPTVSVDGISYGNPEAPVVIEEYFSFLCGACVNFANTTFPQLDEKYIKTGKVRFVFYPYPPYELGAASFCAQEAGKYKEYADYLYTHTEEIQEPQDLIDFAGTVGMNAEEFTACFDSEEAIKRAQDWHAVGSEKGIDATPTFYIDGEKFVGAQPLADFEKIIDAKLAGK
jgi:protein-disulfide isomerase